MLEKTDINIFKNIKFGPNVYICTREISLNYMYELIRYSKENNSKIHIIISDMDNFYETLFGIKYEYSEVIFSKMFDIVEYLKKEMGYSVNLYYLNENNTFYIASKNIIFGSEKLYKNSIIENYSFVADHEDNEKMCKHIKYNILPYAQNINNKILEISSLYNDVAIENNLLHLIKYFINDYSIPQNTIRYFKYLEESTIWQTLFDFQKDGVIKLINILEKEQGAFLCDDVGLGKTFQTLAIIKYFNLLGISTLIFAPKNLVGNWERYKKEYKSEFTSDMLDMQVYKHTTISIPSLFDEFMQKYSFSHVGLIVIDEAHFYRNNSTIGYKNLQKLLKKCNPNTKVLMISATPINNDIIDLENLTKLALSKSLTGDSKIQIINQYRKKAKNEFEYRNTISDLVVRRTRNDIKLNYVGNLSFPRIIRNQIFTSASSDKLSEEIGKIINLQIYDTNTQLINLLLFKRLESSFVAFSNTINNIMRGNIISIEEEGYEIEELPALNYNSSLQKMKELLESDIFKQQGIEKEIKLVKEVDKIIAKNEKVLIFSCYKDTTSHLYELLREKNSRVAIITGEFVDSSIGNITKDKILDKFSPISRNVNVDTEIDILIATDVISEGQNLQDCGNIIHYDLHWNPVRQIQREGRINRIGSKNNTITATTFWPTKSIDEYLRLKDRIEYKEKIGQIESSGFDLLDQNTNLEEEEEEGNTDFLKSYDISLLKNFYGLQVYIETKEKIGDYFVLTEDSNKYIFSVVNANETSIVSTLTLQKLSKILKKENVKFSKLEIPKKIKEMQGRKVLILEMRSKNE